jgi:hypothetical protein
VQGSWRITPDLPEGAPTFVALAAFGAGGILVTTGSDEPGTGIGQWKSTSKRGFTFAYTNFHFDPAGALSHTVDVTASGTFKGRTMKGAAKLTRTSVETPGVGSAISEDVVNFTGRRMPAV